MSAAICIHCQGSTGAICATPSGSAHWLCHFRAEIVIRQEGVALELAPPMPLEPSPTWA